MSDYKVLQNEDGSGTEVSVLLKIGELRDTDGTLINYEHETQTFLPGEIIPGDKISPLVVNDYEQGDEHVRSLIISLDDEETPKPRRPRGRTKKEPHAEEKN